MELSSTHPQFYRCWNLSWVFWLFWDLLLFLFRGAFEVCRPFEGRDTLKKSNIHKRALTVRPGSEVNKILSLEFQCLTWLLCFLIPQRFITKIDSYVAKGARNTHSTSACSRCRTHAMCLQNFCDRSVRGSCAHLQEAHWGNRRPWPRHERGGATGSQQRIESSRQS